MDRDKKLLLRQADPVVPCESATGDDAVHVYMIKEFLVPGMEELDDAGCCTKELLIGGKFQKRIGTASMKEAMKKGLVAIEQRIEFMGQGKNDMEVRGIDDLSPAIIDPEFFLNSLAVRAVTVTAGIIVYFSMAAVGTDREVAAELTGFTV